MFVSASSLDAAPTCGQCHPPSGPEQPQRPVPVPTTPPPDWRTQRLAFAVRSDGSTSLLAVDGEVGSRQGYGTWVDAVDAARDASLLLRRAVAVLDHDGRLYLRTLWATPQATAPGYGRAYSIGALGEREIDFPAPDMRGIVQGDRRLARGDCLDTRVVV